MRPKTRDQNLWFLLEFRPALMMSVVKIIAIAARCLLLEKPLILTIYIDPGLGTVRVLNCVVTKLQNLIASPVYPKNIKPVKTLLFRLKMD